jgi:cold shock CspA family protein
MYPRESAETEPKMQGKCLKFHRDRGFGFLITDDPTMPDIFCHFSDIAPSQIWRRQFLVAGMILEFDVEDAPTAEYPDRLRARNVRVTAPITMAIQRAAQPKSEV